MVLQIFFLSLLFLGNASGYQSPYMLCGASVLNESPNRTDDASYVSNYRYGYRCRANMWPEAWIDFYGNCIFYFTLPNNITSETSMLGSLIIIIKFSLPLLFLPLLLNLGIQDVGDDEVYYLANVTGSIGFPYDTSIDDDFQLYDDYALQAGAFYTYFLSYNSPAGNQKFNFQLSYIYNNSKSYDGDDPSYAASYDDDNGDDDDLFLYLDDDNNSYDDEDGERKTRKKKRMNSQIRELINLGKNGMDLLNNEDYSLQGWKICMEEKTTGEKSCCNTVTEGLNDDSLHYTNDSRFNPVNGTEIYSSCNKDKKYGLFLKQLQGGTVLIPDYDPYQSSYFQSWTVRIGFHNVSSEETLETSAWWNGNEYRSEVSFVSDLATHPFKVTFEAAPMLN